MQKHPVLRFLVLLLMTSILPMPGWADDALFWISTDGVNPGTPGVANFTAAINVPRRLHIWAQPRTSSVGEWNSSTNPFETLKNVSLDIVSPESTFDIDPTTIEVHNPTYSTANPRFGSVSDSSTGLTESIGSNPPFDSLPVGFSKGLLDLQGYSIPAIDGDGFGIVCDASDSFCGTTDNGSPAWLFASFTLTPTAATGSIELWLQIGRNGMSHFAGSVVEDSTGTDVVFGVDSIGLAPAVYNASTNRQETLANDDSDAVLSLALGGDYNADGTVASADYTIWKNGFGTHGYSADGNGDGVVNLADYTVWRNNLGATTLSPVILQSAVHVPEASTIALLLLGASTWISFTRSVPTKHSSSVE